MGSAAVPKKFVRVDPSLVKINTFFRPSEGEGSSSTDVVDPSSNEVCICPPASENQAGGESAPDLSLYCLPSSSNISRDSNRSTNSAMPGAFALNCLCCGRLPPVRGQDGAAAAGAAGGGTKEKGAGSSSAVHKLLPELVETQCPYLSVQELIGEIKSAASPSLTTMLKNHSYVGAVDCYFSLVQHGTQLLLVDHSNLLKDLCYQVSLLAVVVVL
jgi:hypothetical protein